MKTIGYLCSEYPGLSHTFISREIEVLERRGFVIHTASINPTRNAESLGPEDRLRASSTYVLKSTPRPRILLLLLRAGLRNPPRFVSILLYCLGLTWLSGPARLDKSLGYFVQAALLHDWARRMDIKHVHVHFANPASTVALLAARFGDLDFSLSVHGPDEFFDVERNNLRQKVEAATFVRCIGYFCRSQLRRITPFQAWPRLHIVRCGLHAGEFVQRPFRAGAARRLLCVGRVCPAKGQAVLVDAAILLSERGHDFRLVFLGGGEDLEALRIKVQESGLSGKIELAGPVGHARVKEELALADLFVLPSFAEGIPVALMEAMAAGVPVVSTAIAGIPELIEHGTEGFLTRPSDHFQLADTIEGFLRGEVDTQAIVAKAAAKVSSEYDADRNTEALACIFEGLVG